MRVKIIPPPGADRSRLDERCWGELPEGATVADALKLIRCSRLQAMLMLVSVNGERAEFTQTLQEGDVVGFFAPIAGG